MGTSKEVSERDSFFIICTHAISFWEENNENI